MNPRLLPTPPGDEERTSSRAFFERPVVEVARALIGAILTVEGVGGRVVETEAYDRDDPASHSFRGPTGRNGAMFGPVGHVYVYRIYGLHFCLNIVCGEVPGAAVLIRALQPTEKVATMQARRSTTDQRRLCAGPGCVCQSLAITPALDGLPVDEPPFSLSLPVVPEAVVAGPRIGITKATGQPWRFGLAGSPFLSRRFPNGPEDFANLQ